MATKLKQGFGASLETARRIDDTGMAVAAFGMCAALDAAHYRFTARMRELEHQFEAKASELRAAYLAECALAQGD